MKNTLKRTGAFLLSLAMVLQTMFSWGGMTVAAYAADALEAPVVSKKLSSNGDGSYTITLSVTGQSSSSKEEKDINVLIVLDTSNSMVDNKNYTYTKDNSTDGNWQRYGLVDGKYVEVNLRNDGNWYSGTGNSRKVYNGDRYSRSEASRLDDAKKAIGKIVDSLLSNNTPDNPNAVEIATMRFDTTAGAASSWSTSSSGIKNTVNGYTSSYNAYTNSNGGGTNWEAALKVATNLKSNDTDGDGQPDPVYVIFITDGKPTFYDANSGVNGTGQEGDTNVKNSYNAARDDAEKLVKSGKELYGIFAYGSGSEYIDKLINYAYTGKDSGTVEGHSYSASSTSGLESALAAIVKSITTNTSFGKVTINDGITAMTSTEIKAGSTSGFVYTMDRGGDAKTFVPGSTTSVTFGSGSTAVTVKTPASGATVTKDSNGVQHVTWNLGNNYILADKVTYSVSFVVWPDQESYDLVADINNGLKEYSSLTAAQKSQLSYNSSTGKYSLKTNTDQTVDYSVVETVDKNGTTTTTFKEMPTLDIPYNGSMALDGQTMVIKKAWNSDLDTAQMSEIKYVKLVVKYDKESDGKPNDTYMTVKLYGKETSEGSKTYNWSNPEMYIVEEGGSETLVEDSKIFISTGYQLNGEVKDPGHYYTIEETEIKTADGSDSIHFELVSETLHPMLIGKSKTSSSKASLTTNWGSNVATAGTLTATNNLKGGVSIVKALSADGFTPNPNAEFNFRIELGNYSDPNVAYRIYHADGSRTAKVYLNEAKTVTIKAGESIRIQDMPAGLTYTVNEITTGMPAGFSFGSTKVTKNAAGAGISVDGSSASGKAVADESPEITFTNKYEAEPVEASFPVKKVVTIPRGLIGPDDWSFTIKVADDTSDKVSSPLPEVKSVTVTKANPKAVFGPITFTKPGTYVYSVSETSEKSYFSLEDAKTVTIKVKDNGDGTMTVTSVSSTDENTLTFNNTYEVQKTTATPKFSKKLQAADYLNPPDITGKFTFTIKAKSPEDAPLPADTKRAIKNADNGTAAETSFGAITFTKPGTYVYTVTETGSVPGVSAVGSKTQEITIKVVDNKDGTMTATVQNVAKFVNEYTVSPAATSFPAKKILKVPAGLTGPASWSYNVELKAGTGPDGSESPMPANKAIGKVTNDAPVFTFGEIEFTRPGKYTYTVTESGKVSGVTNDADATKTVTVTVVDNRDGTMTATADSTEKNPLSFTNVYGVKSTTATPKFSKTLQFDESLDAPDITGKFTFTIKAKSPADAPLPEVLSKTNTDNGKGAETSFGSIVFTKPGTYVYTVTETGKVNGVSVVGSNTQDITIVVTDNGDGTMTASVKNVAKFVNEYKVTPASVQFPVKKVVSVPTGLTGPASWSYNVKLTAGTDAAGNASPMPTEKLEGSVNNQAPTFTFGTIEFTKPGTYTYTVTEEGTVEGVTNDAKTSKTVTVTVVDNHDGTMTATADSTKDAPLTFTNTYGVKSTTATPKFSKKLQYESWLSAPDITGKFTFTIKAKSPADAPLPAEADRAKTNPDNGTAQLASFGAIKFTKPGTYVYTVEETGSVKGVSAVGGTTREITIVVVDNGNGTMTASVKNDAEFTNEYTAAPAKAELPVKKLVSVPAGFAGPANWSFAVKLEAGTDAAGNASPMPESKTSGTVTKAEPVFKFGEITFTRPGTYTYTVTESGSVKGVTNDKETSKTITVTVTDNNKGALVATATSTEQSPLTFTNTYSTGSAKTSFPVSKIVSVPENLKGPASWSFNVKLSAGTDAAGNASPMPESNASGTVSNEAPSFTFGEIEFVKPGKYTYTVSESGTVAGVTNDAKASKTVTVTVVDNGDGTLTATADSTEKSPLTFTNTYSVKSVKAGFPVKKVMSIPEGLKGPANWSFDVKLEAGNDQNGETSPMPETAITGKVTKDEPVFSFGKIEFTKPGTYTYFVSESGSAAGVSNDAKTTKTVTVTVVDNQDGTLVATATSTAKSPLTFTNTYETGSIKTSFPVKKIVSVPDGLNGPSTWSYEVKLEAGTGPDGKPSPMPKENTSGTVTQDSPIFTFGEITYTKAGKYTYTVTESGRIAGVANDANTSKTVTVTVTDNNDGTLTVSADSTAKSPLTFTNTYGVSSTTATPKFSKTLRAEAGLKAPDITGKFTFTIAAKSPADAPLPETASKVNPDNGKGTETSFGAITFTKPGTYVYTVTESGTVAGVSVVGSKTQDITIEVTDNTDGTMTATVKNVAKFTNEYTVTPAKTSFPVKKIVSVPEGLTGPADWSFDVTLEAENAAPMPAAKAAGKVTKAEPVFTFGEIEFTKPGTYTYKVSESGSIAGVTNDAKATKIVTVTVTDNGDGTLTAAADSTANAPLTFTNTYGVESDKVSIPVEKILDVTAGLSGPANWSFDVTLTEGTDSEGNASPMPAANAEGKVTKAEPVFTFGEIEFTKPGTYTYYVSESGSVPGITNDSEARKTVTVTVVDNGKGKLVATATSTAEKPLQFKNIYTSVPTSTSFPVEKVVSVPEGLRGPASWSFAVKLSAGTDAEGNASPMPAEGLEGTVSNTAPVFTFGDIEFTKPGTYTYTVSESGSVEGVTNDADTSKTVTVTVVDNGEGRLVATADSTADQPLRFTNVYGAVPAKAVPKFSKTLRFDEGLNPPDITGKFTFTISAVTDGAPMPSEKTALTNPDNGKAQVAEFGEIEFTKAGVYNYIVVESGSVDGVSSVSSTEISVTVLVTDNQKGVLTAVVTPDVAAFVNHYTVEEALAVDIPVHKDVEVPEGLEGPEDWSYSIILEDDPSDEVASPLPIVTTRTVSKASPDAYFGAFRFAKPGTYQYIVKESGEVQGVTNDSDKVLTFVVTDEGNGKLSVVCSSTELEPLTFTNKYDAAAASAAIPVNKMIGINGNLIGPKTWSYTVKLEAGTDQSGEASPMPLDKTSGKVNNVNGTFTFGTITFTKPGVYTYSVSEDGSVPGVGFDPLHAGKEVTVTVVDDKKGSLVATASATAENPVVFINPYTVEPLEAAIPATKILKVPDGIIAPEEWSFDFIIEPVGNAPMVGMDGKKIASVIKVDQDTREVAFPSIRFTEPGTYQYKITEDGEVDGIINDFDSVKTATVVVTDNGDGTMKAEVTGVTFENLCVYLPKTGDTFNVRLWAGLLSLSSMCLAVLITVKKKTEY